MTQATAPLWSGWDRYAPRSLPGPLGTSTDPIPGWPDPPLDIEVSLALGADPSADPSTWTWTVIPYARGGTAHTGGAITIKRGRADEQTKVVPSSCVAVLNNRDGRFSPRNPLGAYYGQIGRNTPLRVRVRRYASDPYQTRFVGFVSEWPQRWTFAEADMWVPIQADGILRRLGQGDEPLRSVITRAVLMSSPLNYWPLEDVSSATMYASAVPDRLPARVYAGTVTSGGSDTTLPGTDGFITVSSGGSPYGIRAVPRGVSATSWHIEYFVKSTGFDDNFMALSFCNSSATHYDWIVSCPADAADGFDLLIFDTDFNTTATIAGDAVGADFADRWYHIAVTAEQSGGNIVAKLYVDGVQSGSTSTTAGTLRPADEVYLLNYDLTTTTKSYCHLIVDSGLTLSGANAARDGYAGELAAARISRLADEEGITVDVAAGTTEAMGPQGVDSLLDLWRECEAADIGLLVERLTGELGFDPRVTRYNQTVALALDYDSGHLMPPLEPTDDDQRTRNDVTVTRVNGSSARAVDTDGPLGTDTVGRYDESVSINVYSGEQLPDQASWRLHMGTVDEMRWPRITISLRRNHALIADWLAADVGSRTTIGTLPDTVSYDDADLILEGYVEYLDNVTWDLELNCSPAEPFNVGVYGSATDPDAAGTSHYDTGGSQLAADFDAGTDTSMSVSTTLGPIWTTDADDLPFNIRCGGAVLEVTAISGASSPQTFTITQTPVNGVVKTLTSGTALSLADPAYYAL